jgi:hypothetical protein
LGAAIEAIEVLQGASDDRVQQKRLALERARYEVIHARRQYDVVDPLCALRRYVAFKGKRALAGPLP